MRNRFSVVLALAVVFSLVITSVAMAAPSGELISNELTLEVTVQEEPDKLPIFTLSGVAHTSAVGLYDVFLMTVDPGDYGNTRVLGEIRLLEGETSGFDLYFKGPDGWVGPVKFGNAPGYEDKMYYFGPKSPYGDMLGNVKPTEWRVHWKQAGTYKFEVSIVEVSEEGELGNVLGESQQITIYVREGSPLELKHLTADAGTYAGIKDLQQFKQAVEENKTNLSSDSIEVNVSPDGQFDYLVVADLVNDVDHVDNALFIFEVWRTDDGTITENDFEVTDISLRTDLEGINDTFKVENGALRGYWGPATGFLFKGEAATAFTVKFNTAGTYEARVYVIQVPVQ